MDSSLKNVKFIMKNGCCKECMKAFSKTGKVSEDLVNHANIELFMLSTKIVKKSNITSEWV